MIQSKILSKINVQNQVLTIINQWLNKVNFNGKVIYKSWSYENDSYVKYENFDYLVKCDLAVFLSINNKIFRIFINFKINNFKYELNSRKKALLVQKKNGLVSYDDDAKKAFRITSKDKNAIVIFVANKISGEQTNSWSSRVLCCYADNIIPTIKHQLDEIKKNAPAQKVVSMLKGK